MYSRRYSYLIISGLLLDIFTKYYFNTALRLHEKITIIPNILDFQLVHNYGAAYGIFQNQKLFLITISIIVLFVIIKYKNDLGYNSLTKHIHS